MLRRERVGERHRHWRCGDRSAHKIRRGSGVALGAEFRGSDFSEVGPRRGRTDRRRASRPETMVPASDATAG
jgi:hypothetical protein